jgi:hypothetical protein
VFLQDSAIYTHHSSQDFQSAPDNKRGIKASLHSRWNPYLSGRICQINDWLWWRKAFRQMRPCLLSNGPGHYDMHTLKSRT